MSKEVYNDVHGVKFGCNLGVLVFNSGYKKTFTDLLDCFDISVSDCMKKSWMYRDKLRVKDALNANLLSVKKRRKELKRLSKSKLDKFEYQEGPTYSSGRFKKS